MFVSGPDFLSIFPVAFLAVLTRSGLVVGAATLLLRTRLWQARRIYQRGFGDKQLRTEARAAAVVVIADAAAFAFVRSGGWLPFSKPTPGRTLFTVALLFAWYELWFYATHRVMHTRRLYRIHAHHHLAKVTHPISSLNFGLVERGILLVGFLGFAALAARVVPITLPGLVTYMMLNYVLNVWGHLNVELLPAGYGRSWMARLFISTTFHALHHARYTGHYGLFTPVLDRLFGTVFEDYPEVHARAATGNGLTTMGERVRTAAPPPIS
ncbi:MAG: sterol desaturase family protein [Myxococcaceae bacterium]|nr:sterol desaturase family protein [Myxococcaceae bacterium]